MVRFGVQRPHDDDTEDVDATEDVERFLVETGKDRGEQENTPAVTYVCGFVLARRGHAVSTVRSVEWVIGRQVNVGGLALKLTYRPTDDAESIYGPC